MKTIQTMQVEQAFVECDCHECQKIEMLLEMVRGFGICRDRGIEIGDVGMVDFYATLVYYASEIAQFLGDAHMIGIAIKLGVLEQFLIGTDVQVDGEESGSAGEDIPF